ncbi:MAG: type IV pilus assembly protein PilM, partial [Phycisphaeraceae bacterium]
MARKNESWGIEVGANALKAIHLARTEDGVEVLEYEVMPFKKILTTPDLNVDEAIEVGLDQFLSKHDLSRTTVMVSVPGHLALARFAKLPPVDPKKIPDIVKFEAVQQIPFPIDQVEWDYQVFQQQDSPDVEVGIFAITKDRVMKFLSHYRNVGMRVDGLTLSPLAVYNAMAYDRKLDEDSPGTVMLDVGTTSTDVIVMESGQVWLRTLPIGGNNFTEALVRAFKLSFHKAEKLKRDAGTSKYARQIFQAMRPVFADFVQEVQRSLGYYQSLKRGAELKRLIGVGSTFRLPGLAKFLKQQLQMDVTRPNRFKRAKIEGKQESDFADHALNLATAYGLALQGLGLEVVHANILPRYIISQRLWKAKQPMFAAAAALVVAAVIGAAVNLWIKQTSYDSSAGRNTAKIQSVISRGQVFADKWEEISAGEDPRMKIENLRHIHDYRDVWPKLMEDLNLAVMAVKPQPELLEADADAISAIPRRQRRRLYIESVSSAYRNPSAQTDAAGTRRGSSTRLITDESDTLESDTATAKRPQFVITVKGTTPHAGGAAFISNTSIKWRQDTADRADRPYRILTTENALVWIDPVGTSDEGRTSGTVDRPDRRSAGTRRSSPRGGGGDPPGAAAPFKSPT